MTADGVSVRGWFGLQRRRGGATAAWARVRHDDEAVVTAF